MKTNRTTKRLAAMGALAIFTAVAFSSCKSGEKCPAYSKYEKENKKEVRV